MVGLFWKSCVNKWKESGLAKKSWKHNKERRDQVVAGRHVGTRITRAILATYGILHLFHLAIGVGPGGCMRQSPKHVPGCLPLRALNRELSATPMQGFQPHDRRRCFGHNAFIGRNARIRSCKSSRPKRFTETLNSNTIPMICLGSKSSALSLFLRLLSLLSGPP